MIEIHEDNKSAPFLGTVCDIETVGAFDTSFTRNDIRRFRNIRQVIFGYITDSYLNILCAENEKEIKPLALKTKELLCQLPKPFYAFNTSFEKSVWEIHGFRLHNMEELQCRDDSWGFESKAEAVEGLGIPQYDDPFDDNGLLAAKAWENKDFKAAIAHNRSCLLKEREIALRRFLVKEASCQNV